MVLPTKLLFANASRSSLALIFLLLLYASGCGGKPQLMPTPHLYVTGDEDPFANVPVEMQGNKVPVLYVTDRLPTKSKDGSASDHVAYGHERSRSAAFGVAELQIGKDELSWAELVQASRTAKRAGNLDLSIASARELGRFAPTPPKLVVSDAELAHAVQATRPARNEAESQFIEELTSRLENTPRKEVFMFIHGFNTSFEGAIFTTGELWHFLGREGVPVAYTWPCGEGTLRAYEYTNQSAQFTIYHLKQTLRLIASCPVVEKVHIIAHSRGTDVATTAIRELHLETRSAADTRETFKFGTVVLAAGDLDIDVVIQRMATERIARAVEYAAIYVHKGDKALALSNWLSAGAMRLGDVSPDIFDREEMDIIRASRRVQFIDARVTKPGSLGHNYFHANPAVSSDLILLLRYQRPPGAEHGRPLGVSDTGFWIIDDAYPSRSD